MLSLSPYHFLFYFLLSLHFLLNACSIHKLSPCFTAFGTRILWKWKSIWKKRLSFKVCFCYQPYFFYITVHHLYQLTWLSPRMHPWRTADRKSSKTERTKPLLLPCVRFFRWQFEKGSWARVTLSQCQSYAGNYLYSQLQEKRSQQMLLRCRIASPCICSPDLSSKQSTSGLISPWAFFPAPGLSGHTVGV